MECEIIYVESETILTKTKDRNSFFIVTKKGFIPVKILQDNIQETLGTESKIIDCHIDHKGRVVVDKINLNIKGNTREGTPHTKNTMEKSK